MDYVDSGTAFAVGPLARLGTAVASNPDFVSAAAQVLAVKGQYDATKATIEASGVHLDKGMIIAENGDGKGVVIYAGDQPDALPALIKLIEPSFPDMVCKSIESRAAGYVACTDAQTELDAYAPGGEAAAAALRARWAASMPGVNYEASNIIADFSQEDIHLAIETPPGLMILSMAVPKGDADIDEMTKALVPAPGKLLRTVQPGA